MNRLSENATDIINDLNRTGIIEYNSEYLPIIDALNKLANYEDAEEQEQLVRLPFSEDTDLYVIVGISVREGRRKVVKEYVVKGVIDRFYFVNGAVSFDVVLDDCNGTYLSLTSEDVGKTVFLTREEAEQALKEAHNDEL